MMKYSAEHLEKTCEEADCSKIESEAGDTSGGDFRSISFKKN